MLRLVAFALLSVFPVIDRDELEEFGRLVENGYSSSNPYHTQVRGRRKATALYKKPLGRMGRQLFQIWAVFFARLVVLSSIFGVFESCFVS